VVDALSHSGVANVQKMVVRSTAEALSVIDDIVSGRLRP